MSKTFILALALGIGGLTPLAPTADAHAAIACQAKAPAALRDCRHRWFAHAVSDILAGRVAPAHRS